MKSFTLYLIRLYQLYVSPHKGFCCAYRQHTGHASCSSLGFRAIRRFGVRDGFVVLRKRLYLCGVSHRRYVKPLSRPHRAQRGDCDLPCDVPCDVGCDLPDRKSCHFLKVLDCADGCGCDWPSRKKGKSNEKDIYLPPQIK